MDLREHYQALYNEMEPATALPIYHVFAGDTQTGAPALLPYITYRQEVEITRGTTGTGALKVLRSQWLITCYTRSLTEGLDEINNIINALSDADIVTADGYYTTALEPIGIMTLYEKDAGNYAVHLRILWERSL